MTTPWSQEYAWAFYAAACILWLIAGVGLYIALFRDRSRGRRRCPKCWYDMAGVPGLKCPECGREARKERRLHTTRRRWRLAALFAFLAALGLASFRAPLALRNGPWAAVPIPILNFVLSWFHEDAKLAYEAIQGSATALAYGGGPAGTAPSTSEWNDLLAAWHAGRELHNASTPGQDWVPIVVVMSVGVRGRPAIPDLARYDGGDVESAINLLGFMSSKDIPEAFSALVDIVSTHHNPNIRALAFSTALGSLSDPKKRAAFLHRCLRNEGSDFIRRNSALALARDSFLSRDEVLKLMAGRDDSIRCGLVEGLIPLASAHHWLMPELLRGVGPDESAMLRKVCLVNASEFGPLGSEWHEPFARHLNDSVRSVRAVAATASAKLVASPLPPDIADSLLKLTHDQDREVSVAAAKATMKRAESFNIPQVQLAWNSLAQHEPESIDRLSHHWDLPALIAILESDLTHLRRIAARRLVDKAATESCRVERMLSLLSSDRDSSIRALCAGLLGHTEARDASITPALVHAGLHDADSCVRAVALRAAESRRDADTELIAALIEALKDPSPEVVLAAANSLARLGPRAAAANDALHAAANHPDAAARDAIADAIMKTQSR